MLRYKKIFKKTNEKKRKLKQELKTDWSPDGVVVSGLTSKVMRRGTKVDRI